MELQLGQTYKVEVIKLIQYGCVVRMEDGSTELIHLSQISNQFVKNVEEFVSIGNVFEAQGVPGLKNPVQLSLKHLNLVSPYTISRPDKPQKANRADNRSLHTPKSSTQPRFNDNRPSSSSSRDKMMDGYESKDDDYATPHTKSRNHSKKYDVPRKDNYVDDINYRNKQRRKDRRSHNNRHRKDKYFD